MDPWMSGLALIMASQKPEMAQQLLQGSSMGVEGGSTDIGGMIDPVSAQGGTPAPAAQAPGMNPMMQMAAMQGIKAPAPVQPLMHGGVTGGVTPPKATAMQTGSPVAQALMQALLGGGMSGQPAQPVPVLGGLLRR